MGTKPKTLETAIGDLSPGYVRIVYANQNGTMYGSWNWDSKLINVVCSSKATMMVYAVAYLFDSIHTANGLKRPIRTRR